MRTIGRWGGDRGLDTTELGVVWAQATSEVETTTRLFDVSRFCTIYHGARVRSRSAADVPEALKRYPGDVVRPVVIAQGSEVTAGTQADVVVNRGGHAYRAYLVVKGEKRVVAVRVDGVVGVIVHSADGLMSTSMWLCHAW